MGEVLQAAWCGQKKEKKNGVYSKHYNKNYINNTKGKSSIITGIYFFWKQTFVPAMADSFINFFLKLAVALRKSRPKINVLLFWKLDKLILKCIRKCKKSKK